MDRGNKEYFKHFSAAALLVCVTIFSAYYKILSVSLLQGLIFLAFVYLSMLFLGLVFNVGYFKYIGKMYVEEAEKERRNWKPKQPWE